LEAKIELHSGEQSTKIMKRKNSDVILKQSLLFSAHLGFAQTSCSGTDESVLRVDGH
jgi:hypothetical protein